MPGLKSKEKTNSIVDLPVSWFKSSVSGGKSATRIEKHSPLIAEAQKEKELSVLFHVCLFALSVTNKNYFRTIGLSSPYFILPPCPLPTFFNTKLEVL